MPVLSRAWAWLMAAALLVVATGAAAPAPSAGSRAAVVPIAFEAKLEAHWKQRFAAGLGQGLAHGRFEVVESDRVCADPECFQKLAASANAEFVVVGQVRLSPDGDYALALRLLDSRGGEVARASAPCELCGAQQAANKFEDLASSLRARLDALVKTPPRVTITTRPPGASVAAHGRTVGVSPLSIELRPGPQEIDISLDGYKGRRLTVTGVAGVEDRREIVLERLADRSVPRLRAAGWTLVGLGIAALPAGVVLTAIDSRAYRRDCQEDRDGRCRQSYDTIAGGITLLVSSGVALIIGSTLLGVARRRAKR